MRLKHSLSIFGKLFMFSFHIMDKPKYPTTGFTSRVPHTNKHIILIDYDNAVLWIVEDELRALQEEFKLGDFHILKTSETGFHCVCLDEVRLHELRRIQLCTSCDLGFKVAPRYDQHRNWVLRWDRKGNREPPVYIETLLHKSIRPQHLGSAKFLEANYGVPIEFLENSDGNEKICQEGYLTAKRVK